MPRRGELNPNTGLFFWRKARGKEYWITEDELMRRRLVESQRRARFYEKNPDYLPHSHTEAETKRRSKEYRENNKEKCAKSFANWAKKNKEHLRRYANERYRTCPEYRARILANGSFRRAAARNMTASERFCVEFLYSFSQAVSAGGFRHVVDHVFPIKPQSGLYCGLTNSNNLRVITETQNMRKKNKCPIISQQ